MKGKIERKSRNCFQTVAILSVLAVLVFTVSGQVLAWDLKEAAKPYEGATIRTIGEALPPLEALDKVKLLPGWMPEGFFEKFAAAQ